MSILESHFVPNPVGVQLRVSEEDDLHKRDGSDFNSMSGEDQLVEGDDLIGHDECITAIAYSPDGTMLATASTCKDICIWNLAERSLFWVYEYLTAEVRSLLFSPNGQMLAGTMADESGKAVTFILCLAQPEVERFFRRYEHPSAAEFLFQSKPSACFEQFSPDNKFFVYGSDSSVGMVQLGNNGHEQLQIMELLPNSTLETILPFTPDSRYARFVYQIDDDMPMVMRVVDVWTGDIDTVNLSLGSSDQYAPVGSPDGLRIAGPAPYGPGFQICDAMTGLEIAGPFVAHYGILNGLCFSPDGGRIVDCSEDGSFIVWDAYTGEKIWEPLVRVDEAIGGMTSICYSPRGDYLVGGFFTTLAIWDAQSGEIVSGHPLVHKMFSFDTDSLTHHGGRACDALRTGVEFHHVGRSW
ncbi:WD40 repeat-like protein [Coniophora puteana RWD-64-598 SS2]|uniref:WD40 repeat-like protein n=1 Tax=Coniophora puteana (strain RWD-64-598) TaxID=741705 RepID=A0A5M3MZX7_CONPW|nr:WD40 repeat-like protein [Coniophora puteana RWD-64-598 SS2]EIW84713.1 WD40 repeat-like protein [Coniophora puteana RWD-64-598 SS2]